MGLLSQELGTPCEEALAALTAQQLKMVDDADLVGRMVVLYTMVKKRGIYYDGGQPKLPWCNAKGGAPNPDPSSTVFEMLNNGKKILTIILTFGVLALPGFVAAQD